jgi:Adenylate kinase and related kinases
MKIFIVGMPKSGRTTISKALCEGNNCQYIDAVSWVRSTFRAPHEGEKPSQYEDEYHQWFTNRLKMNHNLIIDNVRDSITAYGNKANVKFDFVIDGLSSPRDLVQLFNYNEDVIVFLNRTNNSAEYKDYENIGVSVMRDYCFWLSSADLLPKTRWFEYNFSIPGEDLEQVKCLGHKNSVFIVKSINRLISHLKEKLAELSS